MRWPISTSQIGSLRLLMQSSQFWWWLFAHVELDVSPAGSLYGSLTFSPFERDSRSPRG